VLRSWKIGAADDHFVLNPSITPDDQIILVGDFQGNVYLIHKEQTEILHKFNAHSELGKNNSTIIIMLIF